MNNEIIDALVYSNLKNNLQGPTLNKMSSVIISSPGKSINETLDNLLTDTIIKRACCNNHNRIGNEKLDKYVVNVRIPIPKDYDFSNVSDIQAQLYKKFGYIDKPVYVPASMCNKLNGTYDYNSNQCQDFMNTYCNTMNDFYQKEIDKHGGKYSDDEFYNYKPECGCYSKQPSYITGSGVPAVCYAPGCDPSNNNVFVDTNSRKGCSVTICQTNLDTSGLAAGGNVNINSKVAQQCGNQINKDLIDDKKADPTITPGTPTIEPSTDPITDPITDSTIKSDDITTDTINNTTNEETDTTELSFLDNLIEKINNKKTKNNETDETNIILYLTIGCILFIILIIILIIVFKK